MSSMLFLFLLYLIATSYADDSSLRFLMLGDWGISGYNQQSVAKAMGTYASKYKQDFVLLLGDNFYTSGAQSTSDSQWSSMFEKIYLSYSSLQVPYYPVLGNHDWGYGWTGGYAQVKYSSLSSYWKMPALNYSMNFDIPGGGTVSIVFVETCRLAVSQNKWCNYKGGTVSYNQQVALINQQLERVDKMLADAVSTQPTWLLVVGHYEVFSAGDHGDMSEMKQYLLPLLQKHNVDAYICGHDHVSEILTYGKQLYVVAGAGAMVDYLKTTSSANLVWYGVGYSAFGSAIATTSALTFSFIDTSCNTKVAYSLAPKSRTQQPTSTPTVQPTSQPSSIPTAPPTLSPTRTSYEPLVLLSVVAGVTVGSILVAAAFYSKRGSWSYHRNSKGASSTSIIAAATTAPISTAPLERPSRKSVTAWVDPPPNTLSASYTSVSLPVDDIPESTRDRSATEAANLIEDGQGQCTTTQNRRSKTTLF